MPRATTRQTRGIQALRDPLDRAALPGRVAALEQDDHFQSLVLDPLLQFHQFNLQFGELAFVGGFLELAGFGADRGGRSLGLVFLSFCRRHVGGGTADGLLDRVQRVFDDLLDGKAVI